MHRVQAWAVSDRLWLGQVAGRDHENEIAALSPWLESLALQGGTVTMDRAPSGWGCPRQGAQTIVAQGGHSVRALKDHQPRLHDDVTWLRDHAVPGYAPAAEPKTWHSCAV